MYIESWLLVVVVVVGVVVYIIYKSRKKDSSSDDEPKTIKGMWKMAEFNMDRVLEKSINLEKYLQDERDMVQAMERDMIRLRERYKHNDQKQKEIAHDWMDYSSSIQQIKFAREMLDVDMDDDAYDNFDERAKEAYIKVQEIGDRVAKELGKDSSSKLVHDRLRKKAKAADEVLNESFDKIQKEEKKNK